MPTTLSLAALRFEAKDRGDTLEMDILLGFRGPNGSGGRGRTAFFLGAGASTGGDNCFLSFATCTNRALDVSGLSRDDGGGSKGEIGGLSGEAGLIISFSARLSADFSSRVTGIRGVAGITIGCMEEADFTREFMRVNANFFSEVADIERDRRRRPFAGGGTS